MFEELSPQYDHAGTEKRIYELWEKSGYFNPDNLPSQDGEPYTIIMPPPNANAPLHVGHALGMTIEDILIRYQRMRGRRALWLPGFDHAGFETQVVFEKKLEKEGRSRFQMQRGEFYKEVWDFVQSNKHISEEGIRRLGASCDWSRSMFTLDPRIVDIVSQTFEQMHKDGLIYRGNRVCNWCTKHQTNLANLETKYEERIDTFYYFKYGPFVIGTARPETKFGDKYVVMHPDDPRYAAYTEGQKIDLEWINGPVTATVIKDKAIDMTFGTGVMTITPWHDAIDFGIAERHHLDMEQIIDTRGRLLPIAKEFAGMKIAEARPKIVERLKEKGLLVEEKTDTNYKHNVQVCYKCATTIEPQVMPQWYMAMTKPLANGRPSLRDMASNAVKNGEVKIVTERFQKVFMHWMENLEDWPISRQIWWGIPIPAWTCLHCGALKINPKVQGKWFLVRHGETDANKEERLYSEEERASAPLNETGKGQAEAAAQSLKNHGIDLIISSDYIRAADTAKIIAEATGAEIIFEEGFRERELGDAKGMLIKEAHEKFGDLFTYTGKSANQESYEELENRIWATLSKHQETHKHKNVVIVGHGAGFRALLRRIRNVNPEEMRAKIDAVPNAKPIQLDILDPCEQCGHHFFEQDPDTFDTWFSSGQWPFATLQALGEKNFETFFPTQVMETGWDILFFWVARMMMLSYYRTGKAPFENVFLHGLVRDKDRQKMSKSKGNVVDPLGVIDTYGTDALRFALIFSTAAGNDIPLAEDKIKGMKHFANKLWNIARFVLTNTGAADKNADAPEAQTDADRAILEQLEATARKATADIENFELHEAAQSIYQFVWHEFADLYIEASKKQLADEAQKTGTQKILMHVLLRSLTLLHPFMPFVTEEIYQKIKPGELLMVRPWEA